MHVTSTFPRLPEHGDGIDPLSRVSNDSASRPTDPAPGRPKRALYEGTRGRRDEKRVVNGTPASDAREGAEALDRCRRGDIEGLRRLYEIHRQRVYRTCVRILGDPSEAEDVMQEVFLRVFEKAAQFGGRANITTWLYRLTVNYCLNNVRGRRNRETRLRPLDGVNEAISMDRPDLDFQRREASDLVERLLTRLTDPHRIIVVLRDIEGLSYREISEVLSLPSGTVMSRLSRARRTMRENLRELQRENCEKQPVVANVREAL